MWVLAGLTLIMLIICSVSDIKERKINLTVILIYLLCVLIYRGYMGTFWRGYAELLLRFMPGIIMLFIALRGKNLIGMGDVILLLATGYALGSENNICMLMCGSVISGIYSLVMLLIKKRKMKDTLPFVPFMLSGLIGMMIIGILRKV